MEQIIASAWEKLTTDPVAAMLAGFVGMTILISLVKRFLARGKV